MLTLLISILAIQTPTAEEIWRSGNTERPEAVHVSADGQWVYYGHQGPEGEGLNGYVSRQSLASGNWDQRWSVPLASPLGMISDDRILYVVEEAERVTALDRQSGERLQSWSAPEGSRVINDLALDPTGRLWATDTGVGRILTLENGQWTVVLEDAVVSNANGIEYVDGAIYVVCSGGVGNLVRIDPDSLEFELLLSGEGSLDGVVTDGRGGLLLSDLRGRLLHWSEAHGITVLDAFEDEEIMLNSIGGTPDGRYVFSPHWRQSQISAHRIDYPTP